MCVITHSVDSVDRWVRQKRYKMFYVISIMHGCVNTGKGCIFSTTDLTRILICRFLNGSPIIFAALRILEFLPVINGRIHAEITEGEKENARIFLEVTGSLYLISKIF